VAGSEAIAYQPRYGYLSHSISHQKCFVIPPTKGGRGCTIIRPV
jgi:hypothetical protein